MPEARTVSVAVSPTGNSGRSMAAVIESGPMVPGTYPAGRPSIGGSRASMTIAGVAISTRRRRPKNPSPSMYSTPIRSGPISRRPACVGKSAMRRTIPAVMLQVPTRCGIHRCAHTCRGSISTSDQNPSSVASWSGSHPTSLAGA